MERDAYDPGASPYSQESNSPFEISSISSENSHEDAIRSDSSSDSVKSALAPAESTFKRTYSSTIPILCRQSSVSSECTMNGSIPSTSSLLMDQQTTTSGTVPKRTPESSPKDSALEKHLLDMETSTMALDVAQVSRYAP